MSGNAYLTTASCIVFVGNIPYGLSEPQMTEIFASVGRVVCFRMVFDRDTGRSKGYGFAEYIDAETAASAVRNLDNYEVMGRKLRVDYSSQGYVGKELTKEGLFSQQVYSGMEGYFQLKNDVGLHGDSAGGAIIFGEGGYMGTMAGSEGGHVPGIQYDVPTKAPGPQVGAMNGMPGAINGMITGPGQIHLNPQQNQVHLSPGHTTTNQSQIHQNQVRPNLPSLHLPSSLPLNATTPSPLLPKLPPGLDPHPSLTASDSISHTLSTIPVSQLLRILLQMKDLTLTDPIKATELLRASPQLSYALFQALIMMNLIEPCVLSQLLEPSSTASAYNAACVSLTAHLTPTHVQQQPFYNGYSSGQEMFVAQRQQQQQQQQHQQQQRMEPEKAALLQRVLVLSQEEISRLPKEQQQQVLLLKHRLMTEGLGVAGGAHLQGGY